MIIGKLRHRVTIQQPIVGRGTDGSNTITYSGSTSIWAQVREANQNETEIGTKITVTSGLEIIVRYSVLAEAINAKSRLIWEEREYMVHGVLTDEKKIYRTISASLIQ